MYKNFNLTESEKEQILNKHKEHGYGKPLNEETGTPEQIQARRRKIIQGMTITRNDYSYSSIENGDYVARKGDHNLAVIYIQEYLLLLNYDIGPKGKDGFFGPDTETAVKKFQQDNNLVVDGKVGKKTQEMLDKLALPIYRDKRKKDKEIEDKLMKMLDGIDQRDREERLLKYKQLHQQ